MNFVRAGYYDFSGIIDLKGAAGWVWTSTANYSIDSPASALRFYFRSSYFRPQDYNYTGYGFSVRCISSDISRK